MLLLIPARDLAHRLRHQNAPWLDLPADVEIINSGMTASGCTLMFLIRSRTFLTVNPGVKVPVFQPELHGLQWKRR